MHENRVIFSHEFIDKIPFQVRASDVNKHKCRQHISNRGMRSFFNVFGISRGTWNQMDQNPGLLFRCTADIVENVANFDIPWARMLSSPTIGPPGLGRCTYDWHKGCSSQKLIRSIPPPIANVNYVIDSTTLGVSNAQPVKTEMLQK